MKAYEADDPMGLVGVTLPGGDSREFVRSIIQEYLMLGWTPRKIMLLFRQSFFSGTHRVYLEQGEEYVRSLVDEVCQEWLQGWIPVKEGTPNA